MAETGNSTAPGAELKAHEETWSGFKRMMTWGTAAAFITGFSVVLLIASK